MTIQHDAGSGNGQDAGKEFENLFNRLVEAFPTQESWSEDDAGQLREIADQCDALLTQWGKDTPFETVNIEMKKVVDAMREAIFSAGTPEGADYGKVARNLARAEQLAADASPKFRASAMQLDSLAASWEDARKRYVADMHTDARKASERGDDAALQDAISRGRFQDTGDEGSSRRDWDFEREVSDGTTRSSPKLAHFQTLRQIYIDYINMPFSDIDKARRYGDVNHLKSVITKLVDISGRWAKAQNAVGSDPSIDVTDTELERGLGSILGTGPGIRSFRPSDDLDILRRILDALEAADAILKEADDLKDQLRLSEAILQYSRVADPEDQNIPTFKKDTAKQKGSFCQEALPLVQQAQNSESQGELQAAEGFYRQALQILNPCPTLERKCGLLSAKNTLTQAEMGLIGDYVGICNHLNQAMSGVPDDADVESTASRYRRLRTPVLNSKWAEFDDAMARAEDVTAARMLSEVNELLHRNDPELARLSTEEAMLNELKEARLQFSLMLAQGPLVWPKASEYVQRKIISLRRTTPYPWLVEASYLTNNLDHAHKVSQDASASTREIRIWKTEVLEQTILAKYPIVGEWARGNRHIDELVAKLDGRAATNFPSLKQISLSLGLVAAVLAVVGVVFWLPSQGAQSASPNPNSAVPSPNKECILRSGVDVCDFVGGPQFVTFMENHPDVTKGLGKPVGEARIIEKGPRWQHKFENGTILYDDDGQVKYFVHRPGSGWTGCLFLDPDLECER